jgi:hypothetical protein
MSMDWFGGKIFTGNHGFYDQKKKDIKKGCPKSRDSRKKPNFGLEMVLRIQTK